MLESAAGEKQLEGMAAGFAVAGHGVLQFVAKDDGEVVENATRDTFPKGLSESRIGSPPIEGRA
jgi:hypothetical protein